MIADDHLPIVIGNGNVLYIEIWPKNSPMQLANTGEFSTEYRVVQNIKRTKTFEAGDLQNSAVHKKILNRGLDPILLLHKNWSS